MAEFRPLQTELALPAT